MSIAKKNETSGLMVWLAFATVYIVWGSTYFFIQMAVHGLPPFMLGAIRFFAAAIIMLLWCIAGRQNIFRWSQIRPAIVSGLLLLFIGNGAVIWVEQFLPSALVAILVSSAPLWFVLLDRPMWSENLRSKSTIAGLLVGFGGVILLFYENIIRAFSESGNAREIGGMALLVIGAMSWAGGSLYSKYYSKGSSAGNSAWQMLSAGFAFLIFSFFSGEYSSFEIQAVPASAWWALIYLILFGSIAGFGAYVWLLEVRPATQVSTYAYVNPVVAVLLGVFFAGESISWLQICGLVTILVSVLLINLVKYRKGV